MAKGSRLKEQQQKAWGEDGKERDIRMHTEVEWALSSSGM